MKKKSLSLVSTTVSASLLLISALTLGCSTFQGPGELQAPSAQSSRVPAAKITHEAALDHDHIEDEDPSIVMNGPRRHAKAKATLSFDWPVDEARMTRGFFEKAKKRAKRRRGHWGIDLANKKGTPILASESGVVIYAGSGFRGYGKLVIIEHNDEYATLYSHLNKFGVKDGDVVEKGQFIGEMGRTGRASGVHLHFEVRHNRKPVNPLAYLPEIPENGGGSLALREESNQP